MPDTSVSSAASAPPAELSKSQRKTVASAGYLVERFGAACDALRKRVQDGRILLPSPWREAVGDAPSTTLQGDGWFVMEFVLQQDGKLRLLPQMLSRELSVDRTAAWTAKDAGSSAQPLLAIPEGFHLSWWIAFLRLRPLRDFWEGELRRSSWEQLVALLPEAWLLDRSPLPAGAVIPGLEITGWNELPALVGPKRHFGILTADGQCNPMDDNSAVDESGAASVLAELPQDGEGQKIAAIYAKQNARVDLVGVV